MVGTVANGTLGSEMSSPGLRVAMAAGTLFILNYQWGRWERHPDGQAVEAQERHASIIPVFVPVARDGSMFLPSTNRNGTYRVGEKGSEEGFDDYQKALAKLQSMPVAKWRRANDQGNWGIVSAIDWRRMDLNAL